MWFLGLKHSDQLFLKHDVVHFPVASIHSGHSIAFLVLTFWVIQLLSGFLLLGLVSYSLEIQFMELLRISTDGNFVWLLRSFHMLGANFCVFLLFIHFGKTLTSSRVLSAHKFILWLTGAGIFLLSLGIAFTGYVLVSGNMSFWACLVILNLFTVIPLLGEELVSALLGGSTVTSWSLRRFTVIHFLLAVLGFAVVALHLVLLHRTSPSKTPSDLIDGSEFLISVLLKDLGMTLLVLLPLFAVKTRDLIHPDNWQTFSRVNTPAHIEPELYFLWTFSIIKLHNGKLLGFV